MTRRATPRTSAAATLTVNIGVVDRDTQPPTVSISSPTSGTIYTTPQTVIRTDRQRQCRRDPVEFYARRAAGHRHDLACAWSISSANNGSHSWTAKAYDAAGNVATSAAVTLTVNIGPPIPQPPTVSISSPASGTTYTTAQTVTISATASDNVGVTKVEFYDNGVLKGTDTTSPYSTAWSISSANNGSHSWTAKAYDAAGYVTTSAAVTLTVNIATADTQPPTVSISSPASGTTYTTAQTVTISATASDNVGVTKVEFYDNGVLKGTDTASPYSTAWSISSANNGSHSWTAKAYDAAGNVTTSAAVTLTVNIATADTQPRRCRSAARRRARATPPRRR